MNANSLMVKYIFLQTHHEVIKESNSQDVKSAVSATKRKFSVYNTLEWLKEECIQMGMHSNNEWY